MAAASAWAIVVVMLHGLSGPQTFVITDAGTFASKTACQAKIAAAVPSTLTPANKQEWQDGYRQYLCVRVQQ